MGEQQNAGGSGITIGSGGTSGPQENFPKVSIARQLRDQDFNFKQSPIFDNYTRRGYDWKGAGMPKVVGLDFETYGAVSLPDHGLARYVNDDTFKVLCASVAWFDADWGTVRTQSFSFVGDRASVDIAELRAMLRDVQIVAHNAGFEAECLRVLGIPIESGQLIDSAVIARAAGAASHLEAAAPQLLGMDKIEMGKELIKLFSIPGPYQEKLGTRYFVPQIIIDNEDKWLDFIRYCEMDATLSLEIFRNHRGALTTKELRYAEITLQMNQTGWTVDVPTVEEMNLRYLENVEETVARFRFDCDAADLNLNSLPQMKKWCADRGIRANSFDEANVAKLLARIEKKLEDDSLPSTHRDGYEDVAQLLYAKQALGGSSLKKLKVILDTQHEGKLKDQYIHCGAGQTLRTSGRSVQMQNLKRLSTPLNMEDLHDMDTHWSNDQLAENLRQVFRAEHDKGALIVGDFSSVESRGLAWLAGEGWKLAAYRQGLDLYKVLAEKIFNIHYDDVLKPQRQTGKVGELSCGYGAGSGAVLSFAAGMGVSMSEGEAAKLVTDWRAANPAVVALWDWLDMAMHECVIDASAVWQLPLKDNFILRLLTQPAPESLQKQLNRRGVRTLELQVLEPNGEVYLTRYFHGVYKRGRNVCYYKPSSRKTGDLWSAFFIDPKTKHRRYYDIYGGKLAGILTQSFCREMFFTVLENVAQWVRHNSSQLQLVGQFHDEIVVDWAPTGPLSLAEAKVQLRGIMTDPGKIKSFPLEAEIKHDFRYTK